jgi:hypothetical protein
MLLNEIDLGKLIKKAGVNKKASGVSHSGNLETPTKNPRHRKFMGQDPEGRGTMADKPGRPSSERTVHAEPTSMEDPTAMQDPTGLENLGEPLERGLSDGLVGDDAFPHPSSKKQSPRITGVAEDPGGQRTNSFGNRYPGARGV